MTRFPVKVSYNTQREAVSAAATIRPDDKMVALFRVDGEKDEDGFQVYIIREIPESDDPTEGYAARFGAPGETLVSVH